MNAMTDTLGVELAQDLAEKLGPETDELARMADVHRRALATYERRIETTRRQAFDETAALEAERRRLEEAFAVDMKRIEARIAEIGAASAARIETTRKLAAVSRRALEALAS